MYFAVAKKKRKTKSNKVMIIPSAPLGFAHQQLESHKKNERCRYIKLMWDLRHWCVKRTVRMGSAWRHPYRSQGWQSVVFSKMYTCKYVILKKYWGKYTSQDPSPSTSSGNLMAARSPYVESLLKANIGGTTNWWKWVPVGAQLCCLGVIHLPTIHAYHISKR